MQAMIGRCRPHIEVVAQRCITMDRDRQLYTPIGVALGTLLGTLAGGVVLLWLNYRALRHPKLANRILVGGLICHLAIVATASMLPGSAWIAVGFVVLQTALAHQVAEALQGDTVRYYCSRGMAAQPLINAAAVGLLAGLAVLLLLVMLIRLLDVAGGSPG
jgi:hypothetical protein